ncbi:hypothetical protein [Roseisalinus antarcticus]|uniref:DUF4189 domain-containing protein n=1 Tax=Roseisalinus antarcticus TaxID=254357 RepID=A0A1Y5SJH6_9RHOB|nr:hypothetical protein [Roseisalinus antarcticus]SLN41055.1 hypothetical protein ROA7023_01621 [Roseisalinus antarcticus]
MIRLAAACLTLLAAPAGAESVAFVQAPEQASGIRFAEDIETAIDGAMEECVAGGAYAEDCEVTTACAFAGWSIDIFAQHEQGNHWHESFCGLPEEAVAIDVAAKICDAEARPWLIECALVQVWAPDGTPQMEW